MGHLTRSAFARVALPSELGAEAASQATTPICNA